MKYKFTIISLLLSLYVCANDTITYSNRGVLIGIGKSNISFLSPITYSSFAIGFTNQKTNAFATKENIFLHKSTIGLLANLNQNAMFNFSEELLWGQYHSIPYMPTSVCNLAIGYAYWADGSLYFKPDNVNNVLYTHINNMAAVVVVASKHYKNMYIKNTCSMPLYGLYYGSAFSQNLPGIIEKENSFWNACKFGSFNINTQIRNDFLCDFRITHKNTKTQTLRVQYGIEYAKLQLHNNVKHAVLHHITISTLILKSFYNHEYTL